MTKWHVGACALLLAAAACNSGDGDDEEKSSRAAGTEATTTTAAAAAEIDLTHLPVGDGKISTTTPTVGVLCTTQPTNGQGAMTMGPWFNGDGTWDATAKYTVDGEVEWPHEFSVTVEGDTRVITGNGLPDHPTGVWPVAADDDAADIDRNMSMIVEHDFTYELPANPTENAEPTCAGGEAGVGLNGVLVNVGIDAAGRDAAAWEVQDTCQGHPNDAGYHQHSISDCIEDMRSGEGGHSDLAAYALDGFGIFGHYGEDGEVLTNEDLDECHGHTHAIEWDGETVEMYHYHATYEFPYTIGCFRGTPINAMAGGGGGGGASPEGMQPPAP